MECDSAVEIKPVDEGYETSTTRIKERIKTPLLTITAGNWG